MKTGKESFEQFVVVPKGEPANFMTADELRFKFDALVAPYLSEPRRAELSSRLAALEEESDISALLALTRPDTTIEQLRVAEGGDD